MQDDHAYPYVIVFICSVGLNSYLRYSIKYVKKISYKDICQCIVNSFKSSFIRHGNFFPHKTQQICFTSCFCRMRIN